MNFQNTKRQEEIQSLKEIKYEQVSESLLLLENAEIKENWQSFKESWSEFLEYMDSAMGNLIEMTEAKLERLEMGNRLLGSSMDKMLKEFTGSMTAAADGFKDSLNASTDRLEKEANNYISKIAADIQKAHERNDSYWRSRTKRNVAVVLYLAVTPVMVLLDLLSRYFGWF